MIAGTGGGRQRQLLIPGGVAAGSGVVPVGEDQDDGLVEFAVPGAVADRPGVGLGAEPQQHPANEVATGVGGDVGSGDAACAMASESRPVV